jgi:cytochrome c5
MKFISTILIFTLLVACGTTKLAPITQADADRAARNHPGATVASLDEGKTNFQHFCTQCHGLKDPTSRTEEQWQKIVPRMAEKAGRNDKKEKIEGAVKESILLYLGAMSKPAAN